MSFTTSTFDPAQTVDDASKAKCFITLVKFSEETLKLLEKLDNKTIDEMEWNPEFDSVIRNVSKTGQCCYPWKLLKNVYLLKILDRLKDLFAKYGFVEVRYDSNDSFERRKDDVIAQLDEFPEAPFTIQRLSEILLDKTHYKNTNSYLFALEKMVCVCTTQKPLTPEAVEKYNKELLASGLPLEPEKTEAEEEEEENMSYSSAKDREKKRKKEKKEKKRKEEAEAAKKKDEEAAEGEEAAEEKKKKKKKDEEDAAEEEKKKKKVEEEEEDIGAGEEKPESVEAELESNDDGDDDLDI